MTWDQIVDIAEVIGGIAGFVGLPLAILLFLRGRAVARLTCAFRPVTKLASVESSVKDRQSAGVEAEIQVLYRDSPVQNVFLVEARLENSGNVPLRRQSVVTPVSFAFPPETELLDLQVARTEPVDLHIILNTERERTTVSFELLNPGDRVYLQLICTGLAQLPSVDGRLEGVRGIEEFDWRSAVSSLASRLLALALGAYWLLAVAVLRLPIAREFARSEMPSVIALVLVLLVLVAGPWAAVYFALDRFLPEW